jgi:RNase P subunit RPR2
MSSFLACTNCHEVVVKSMNNEVKVRAKVILIRGNSTFAVCKGCDTELEVPLKFDLELAKSMTVEDARGPRLYLKKC